MNATMITFIRWVADFLRDGENGGNSSSRLIACGSATIMALYILADMVSRFIGQGGMNENVLLACVAGLVTLGGGTYIANKVTTAKRVGVDQGAAA